MTDTRTESPEDWAARPRPLNFVRVRLYMDTAQYLRDLLNDEMDNELERLAKARGAGKPESHEDITEARSNLQHINSILKDTTRGLVELVGPATEER